MLDRLPTQRRLRGLHLRLAGTWALAWLFGIGALALVAIRVGGAGFQQDLDGKLALSAMATYGLTWFDESGRFHDEVWALEPQLAEGDIELWVVEPGKPLQILLGPTKAAYGSEFLGEVSAEVLHSVMPVTRTGRNSDGSQWRLHAIPTFSEGESELPRAVVVAVIDPSASHAAQRSFEIRVSLFAGVLGALGLGVGLLLARWSLRPLALGFEQRERFLVAAAHELRTPVAAMKAVCESAGAGDEAPELALERTAKLATRTGVVLEDLLLFARLESASSELDCQPLRLDLLVEDVLADELGNEAVVEEESTVTVDAKLVRVALRNILSNARVHGAAGEDLSVRVKGAEITVGDHGAGFPQEVLESAKGAFAFSPSRGGVGIGLAISRLIAELHGGGLELKNLPAGGAQARLWLAPDPSS